MKLVKLHVDWNTYSIKCILWSGVLRSRLSRAIIFCCWINKIWQFVALVGNEMICLTFWYQYFCTINTSCHVSPYKNDWYVFWSNFLQRSRLISIHCESWARKGTRMHNYTPARRERGYTGLKLSSDYFFFSPQCLTF